VIPATLPSTRTCATGLQGGPEASVRAPSHEVCVHNGPLAVSCGSGEGWRQAKVG
jgi:hypothetical protein